MDIMMIRRHAYDNSGESSGKAHVGPQILALFWKSVDTLHLAPIPPLLLWGQSQSAKLGGAFGFLPSVGAFHCARAPHSFGRRRLSVSLCLVLPLALPCFVLANLPGRDRAAALDRSSELPVGGMDGRANSEGSHLSEFHNRCHRSRRWAPGTSGGCFASSRPDYGPLIPG